MYRTANVATYAALFNAAYEKVASLSPLSHAAMGGAGTAALTLPVMYYLMKQDAERKRKTTRNTAFGGGVAAGLAAPHITQGLFNIAQRTGFLPQSAVTPFDPSMLGPAS